MISSEDYTKFTFEEYYIAILINKKGELTTNHGKIIDSNFPPRTLMVYWFKEKIDKYDLKLSLDEFLSYNNSSLLNEVNDFYFPGKPLYLSKHYCEKDNKLKSGDIVNFIDDGYHLGLILRVDRYKSYMLMITSNPYWNKRSRRITKEEFSLLGMPQRKQSYFAPVLRSNEDLSLVGISYPEHRVKELIEEFY